MFSLTTQELLVSLIDIAASALMNWPLGHLPVIFTHAMCTSLSRPCETCFQAENFKIFFRGTKAQRLAMKTLSDPYEDLPIAADSSRKWSLADIVHSNERCITWSHDCRLVANSQTDSIVKTQEPPNGKRHLRWCQRNALGSLQ